MTGKLRQAVRALEAQVELQLDLDGDVPSGSGRVQVQAKRLRAVLATKQQEESDVRR